jgi:two-component system response regulator VicR
LVAMVATVAFEGVIPDNNSMTEPAKILVVDDESNILDVLELYLLREGFHVVRASDGQAALRFFNESQPDLVILDLMLPKVEGLSVLKHIRQQNASLPVILLTAKSQEDDKLAGFAGGADDYVTKPFSPRELVARVKVALRRNQESQKAAEKNFPKDAAISLDGLYINRNARKVEMNGKAVELTAKEFDLLWFLANNQGQVFSREQLLDKVWDYSFFGEMSTVTVHIRRLREKVEADPMRPRHIKTVWGVGYKFEP